MAHPATPGKPGPTGARRMTDPFALFSAWFEEATASEPNDPNAMCLATATPGAAPSARMVLLKGLDGPGVPGRGFVFYTNLDSRKGGELAANPQVALLFHWKTLGRQVRVEGRAAPVPDAEADAYYATRARMSRIGAWASRQSRPLASRDELEAAVEAFDSRFPGEDIPRPSHWSGFRVTPARIEFWRDMPFRLHERTVFEADGEGWRSGHLYP
jgi:pyridoxamine 5'-phosphate oxidase